MNRHLDVKAAIHISVLMTSGIAWCLTPYMWMLRSIFLSDRHMPRKATASAHLVIIVIRRRFCIYYEPNRTFNELYVGAER